MPFGIIQITGRGKLADARQAHNNKRGMRCWRAAGKNRIVTLTVQVPGYAASRWSWNAGTVDGRIDAANLRLAGLKGRPFKSFGGGSRVSQSPSSALNFHCYLCWIVEKPRPGVEHSPTILIHREREREAELGVAFAERNAAEKLQNFLRATGWQSLVCALAPVAWGFIMLGIANQ